MFDKRDVTNDAELPRARHEGQEHRRINDLAGDIDARRCEGHRKVVKAEFRRSSAATGIGRNRCASSRLRMKV